MPWIVAVVFVESMPQAGSRLLSVVVDKTDVLAAGVVLVVLSRCMRSSIELGTVISTPRSASLTVDVPVVDSVGVLVAEVLDWFFAVEEVLEVPVLLAFIVCVGTLLLTIPDDL